MYGLKVHNRRVLVPVGKPCPFGCVYCYARSPSIEATWSVEEILTALTAVPTDQYDILQLGYDSDPLAVRTRFFDLTPPLLATGKHLNISTKGVITAETRTFLKTLGHREGQMSAFVSFSCWESAPALEPRTPSPEDRIRTIEYLTREAGISTFVALRPIIPTVPLSEIETIVSRATAVGAAGAIAGPLYLDKEGVFSGWLERPVEGAASPVPWSPVDVNWVRSEDPVKLEDVRQIAERVGVRFYTSSVAAIHEAMSGVAGQHDGHDARSGVLPETAVSAA